VVRRAGRDQADALDVAQFLVADAHLVEGDGPVLAAAIQKSRANRAGLFVDLLGHEVVVTALFGGL